MPTGRMMIFQGVRGPPPEPAPERPQTPSRNRRAGPPQGGVVEPGRIIPSRRQREREARQNRQDSAIGGLDGQNDPLEDDRTHITAEGPHTTRNRRPNWYDFEHTWAAFWAKVQDHLPRLMRRWAHALEPMDLNFDEQLRRGIQIPEDIPTALDPPRFVYRFNARAIIFDLICLLAVFGAFYFLFEYLPSFPRASACSITTVYVPITYTITSGMPASNSTTPDVTYTSTTTHTSTATETFTVTAPFPEQPQASSTAVDPTTGSPAYAYTVNSAGSTEWINGNSPSSGAMLATVTSTVTIQPVPPGETAAAIQSTSTVVSTETVTPPPYTSAVYSFMTPDLTSTSTRTHFVTYTLTQAASAASITTTRTTLPGPSSAGWNTSSTTTSIQTEQTSGPTLTTITDITYYGTGRRTTSTYTTLVTTTVQSEYTTTISQVIESSLRDGETTTLTTGIPVTMNPGTGGVSFSTSVTAPGPVSPSSQTSQATAYPAAGTTSASFSSLSLNGTTSTGTTTNPYATPASFSSLVPSNGSASTGSPTPGNPTAVSSTQSGTMSISQSGSITHTISAAALTGTLSLSSSPYGGSSFSAPTSSSSKLPASITNTISSITPTMSPHFSANGTKSVVSNESPSTGSSATSAGVHTTGTSSNGTVSGTSSGSPNSGRHSSQSTSTSTVYEFSTPKGSPTNSQVSQTPRVSIPSPSIPTRSPPALSASSSPPSTLNTSRRSKVTQGSDTSAILSPTSVISTPYSLASINSTTTSRGGRTSRTTSTLRGTTQSTESSGSQSSGGFTIQTSMPSSASTASTQASNPFPASSATATPSAGCGEQGPFTINFDDLPRFMPTPNQTQPDITNAPPIPAPYHHLTFSDGYVYAPEPKEPYQPVSPPHLAVFLANATGKSVSPFINLVKPGEIGDGPRESISAFWFDAMSGYFGCDNAGPQACVLQFSAYTWSAAANDEILTYAQNATIPACPSLTSVDCQLQKVEFPQSFRGLTGLQVQAFTGNDQRMVFMDNLEMDWTNTSCAAGLLRQSSS